MKKPPTVVKTGQPRWIKGRRRFLGLGALMLSLAFSPLAAAGEESREEDEQAPLVVFLVRHAEKSAVGDDPQLSGPGQQRAQALAKLLLASGIQQVHSSDYARTRETAAPVAAALEVPVRLYDPRKLTSMAAYLRRTGGRHLVVGHSNTTPELVELMHGDAGAQIDEEREYDRLYIVTVAGDSVATVLLRYPGHE
jgi:phosphohistidine phosphatase SixA